MKIPKNFILIFLLVLQILTQSVPLSSNNSTINYSIPNYLTKEIIFQTESFSDTHLSSQYFLCSEGDYYLPDMEITAITPGIDELSWGTDWIDAELVWGGTEDATSVSLNEPAGEGIKIAIIDSGMDFLHQDLDDNFVLGYNAVYDTDDITESGSHGTYVSGVIGAEDNNIPSTIGVAPLASLYPIKVVDNNGAIFSSYIIDAIEWAIANEMDIINISLGGQYYNPSVQNAINDAWNAGIVIVAGAGNIDSQHPNPDILYPAAYDNVIAVGSLIPIYNPSNEVIAVEHNPSSCHGAGITLTAPGSAILTTQNGGGYVEVGGTSIASPMVAGVVALMFSANYFLTPDEVYDILTEFAFDLGDYGYDLLYGYGQVRADIAVYEAERTNPSDSDGDGLYDREEMRLGTSYSSSDSDDDGLTDYEEVNGVYDMNEDGDYLDAGENHGYITDPTLIDTDGDLLSDYEEINGKYDFNDDGDYDDAGEDHGYITDPNDRDTDNDLLLDYFEITWYFTNPLNPDTDNDGLTDGEEEYTYDTDSLDPDTDNDYLKDGWEVTHSYQGVDFDPLDGSDGWTDHDNDGLYTGFEVKFIYTLWNDPDTDNDGWDDGVEVYCGSDPLDISDTPLSDYDGDGITNYDECYLYGTDPYDSDTDGDNFSDYREIFLLGTDPLDPNDPPGGPPGGGFFP